MGKKNKNSKSKSAKMSNTVTTETEWRPKIRNTETTETNGRVGRSSANGNGSSSGANGNGSSSGANGSSSSSSSSGANGSSSRSGAKGRASKKSGVNGSGSSSAKGIMDILAGIGIGSSSANGIGSGSGGEDDIFKPILQVVDELYDTRDNFFPPTPLLKISKMKEQVTSALQLLDSISVENRNSPMRCATYEYLRGKILDSLPSYKEEAEEHLTKAAKLNPSLGDAWLSLGNCMWKKLEVRAARFCITQASSKGLNKRTLCQLSILEREMAQDGTNVGEVLDSVKHAREAVAMDGTDGFSWYCLGNALMNSFFATGARDLIELQESLKAYQNAELDAKMKYNPNLSFNGASVNRYLENYEQALNGFEAAAIKNPCLNANQEIRKMVELFDTIGIFLITFTNTMELAILDSSPDPVKSSSVPGLDAVALDPPYRRATLDILQEGVNKAFAIVGKVVFLVNNENRTPRYYILCDSNDQCYVLTVYGTQADAIKEGDQVTILDPCYRHQDFAWMGKRYVFESLRVDFLPTQVRVNGQALSTEQTSWTLIYTQFKPL